MSTLVNLSSNYLNGGIEATRLGTAHASIVPYETFQTGDGYFTVGKLLIANMFISLWGTIKCIMDFQQ